MRKFAVIVGVSIAAIAFFAPLLWTLGSISPQAKNKKPDPWKAPPLKPLAPDDPNLPPRAVADETHYDAGVMDPRLAYEHIFEVRNEGQGPLRLKKGGVSCTCTVAGVSDNTIPPGEAAQVKLEWTTRPTLGVFSQSATFQTNDPENPRLRFTIEGTVKTLLGVIPEQRVLLIVSPDQSARDQITVFSEQWSDFEITKIGSSLDGVELNVEPIDPSSLDKEFKAKSAYRVTIATSPDLEEGSHRGVLQIAAQPSDGSGEPQEREIALTVKVLRRLAVYGPQVDSSGLLDLGMLDEGQGASASLTLKVRDELRTIALKSVQATPEFLQASIAPYGDDSGETGLYRLHIAVPRDAPVCQHLGPDEGLLRLELDHPRISSLELRVRMAVLPEN